MMSKEQQLKMANQATEVLAKVNDPEYVPPTRSKAKTTKRIPQTEIPEMVEIIGSKPASVAVTTHDDGSKKVTSIGTGESTKEKKPFWKEVLNNGAQVVNMTQLTLRGKDGRLYKKTLPNTDRDLQKSLGDVFSSKLSAYSLVRDALEVKGYHVAIDPKGSAISSGHIIFKESKPDPLPGINYPSDYTYLKPIGVQQLPEFSGVLQDTVNQQLETVVELIEAIPGHSIENPHSGLTIYNERQKWDTQLELSNRGGSKDEEGTTVEEDKNKFKKKAFNQIMQVWSGFELFNKTAMQCGVTLAYERQPYQRPINVDGSEVAGSRFVPQVSWFDEKLQAIDNEQLLSLLPEAEREVMMIFLGRVMLGRQGTPFTNGGVQDLKWRSLVCFEGPQAGMGRTTLLDYLSQGMKICGYNAEAIDDLTGRFGHGRTATADFGFIDDLDPQGTIRTLSSALLKTVASGGTLKVEEKGQMSYQVTAMGAYMLCTNQLNLAALAELDSGNLSRLMPMRNACSNDRRAKEYKAKYGVEINTDLTYEKLAADYQVPIETLVLLLLARSAEKFKALMEKGQRELVATLENLKKQFIINTDMNYIDEMFKHYANLQAIQSDNGSAPSIFDIHKYLTALVKLNGTESIPGCSDSPDLILEYARSSLGSKKRGSATVIKEFMSVLSSDFGLGYISDHGKLLQLYRQKVEQFDTSEVKQALKSIWDTATQTETDKHWLSIRDKLKVA
jgi:hypothetical protein